MSGIAEMVPGEERDLRPHRAADHGFGGHMLIAMSHIGDWLEGVSDESTEPTAGRAEPSFG